MFLVFLLLTLEVIGLDELRYVAIDVFDDLQHPLIALFGIVPFVNYQAVNFVQNKHCLYLSFPGLADDCGSLGTDAFNTVDHDDGTV